MCETYLSSRLRWSKKLSLKAAVLDYQKNSFGMFAPFFETAAISDFEYHSENMLEIIFWSLSYLTFSMLKFEKNRFRY